MTDFSELSSQRCSELFWQCYRKRYFVSILSNWGGEFCRNL